jgi:hypothetical protein
MTGLEPPDHDDFAAIQFLCSFYYLWNAERALDRSGDTAGERQHYQGQGANHDK